MGACTGGFFTQEEGFKWEECGLRKQVLRLGQEETVPLLLSGCARMQALTKTVARG